MILNILCRWKTSALENINKRLIGRKATAVGHEMGGNYRKKLINRRSDKKMTYEYNKK